MEFKHSLPGAQLPVTCPYLKQIPRVVAPLKEEARKNTYVNHFIYLGKKHVYWIFKTSFVISGLLSIKWHLFHNFNFVQITPVFP
jgi:hypothetical protein